jgi:hypothetical protein
VCSLGKRPDMYCSWIASVSPCTNVCAAVHYHLLFHAVSNATPRFVMHCTKYLYSKYGYF